MRATGFSYEVRIEACYTRAEVELLRRAARAHYDAYCREVAEAGPRGFINGMVNSLDGDLGQYHLNEHQIDVLQKCVEFNPSREDPEAWFPAVQALGRLRALVQKEHRALRAERCPPDPNPT